MIFSDSCNVLSNISKVNEYPFPYAGTFDCLPEEVYKQLSAARPPWQALAHSNAATYDGVISDELVVQKLTANNKRLDLPAASLMQSKNIAPIWRDFVQYHTSHNFYLKILEHFEGYFLQFYPQLKDIRKYSTAVRYEGKEADIYMDCQLSINTPVREKSTVNHPHVDNPLELWASLLYMKEPDDNAGGDLMLHKCIKPPKFHGKREADLDCIKEVIKIPYSPNAYACFINTPLSIHSVTERDVTDKARLMVNISLEFRGNPLFYV